MPYEPIDKLKHSKILVYFYQWYILPLIVLHELLHFIFAILTNTKVIEFKIFKGKHDVLYNGVVFSEIPSKKWKQILISYSPILLLIPFGLMFFYNIFIFISIYFLTTTVRYEKRWINVIFPSKIDIKQVKDYDYNKYVLDYFGREQYYKYYFSGILYKKINESSIIPFKEFKKKNKE